MGASLEQACSHRTQAARQPDLAATCVVDVTTTSAVNPVLFLELLTSIQVHKARRDLSCKPSLPLQRSEVQHELPDQARKVRIGSPLSRWFLCRGQEAAGACLGHS